MKKILKIMDFIGKNEKNGTFGCRFYAK